MHFGPIKNSKHCDSKSFHMKPVKFASNVLCLVLAHIFVYLSRERCKSNHNFYRWGQKYGQLQISINAANTEQTSFAISTWLLFLHNMVSEKSNQQNFLLSPQKEFILKALQGNSQGLGIFIDFSKTLISNFRAKLNRGMELRLIMARHCLNQ